MNNSERGFITYETWISFVLSTWIIKFFKKCILWCIIYTYMHTANYPNCYQIEIIFVVHVVRERFLFGKTVSISSIK